MPSTNESATIVFANCAGVARGEKSNPKQLGQYLNKKGLLKGIVAVGLAEVLISIQSLPRCTWSGRTKLLSPYDPKVHLDDLHDFQTGFEGETPKAERYYLSHLNSRDHRHPQAIEGKWGGSKAAKRIVEEFDLLYDVYQGTGALLFPKNKCKSLEGIHLRPAGEYPLTTSDEPLEYRGNRDSEPRSAIVFRELSLLNNLEVDLAFCQIETNTQDKRVGTEAVQDLSRGVNHRIAQIDRLCSHLKQERVILMGDFNARPGSTELDYLCDRYGFRQVFPNSVPSSGTTSAWGKSYTFNRPDADRPDFAKSEKDQDWPYSHLEHGILIDHAFVRGLDGWTCCLNVIELPDESSGKRVSDHRPIALVVS